ncbi:unnamed protein product [Allacma fusca]|uniref:Uncharacterized protein n=1 Tax=Allacma fusca TaxID=39272 RepID=A0A8J2JV22_9HEXA|nr:unnamed protein product [Allacma fusca]
MNFHTSYEIGGEQPQPKSVAEKFKILLTFFPTTTKTPVKKFGQIDKPSALTSKLSKTKPPNSGQSNSSMVSVSNYVKGSHPNRNSGEQTNIPGTYLPQKGNENKWVAT